MLHTLTKGWYIKNIGIEISMYTQMFILVNAAVFLEQIKQSSLIIEKMNKQSKTSILIKLTKIW